MKPAPYKQKKKNKTDEKRALDFNFPHYLFIQPGGKIVTDGLAEAQESERETGRTLKRGSRRVWSVEGVRESPAI